ncbi:hypothetical protein A2526_01475 [candidate division WOR-1 bacterium RIFOXYD2_FULL_36_8]|uniref:Uncharacterized protein n=1 Tax=candidate division WOR-1 bacterium RIFOXYB2_FULL_36_35 TaxID=1802578 RepID=A0A1F4S1A4_UNCSA|nr:MAG: hypothetical protein A2230_03575 [candidate division WOR-1 bacterium RIFOXYA2_FULL_36_21]OGC14177.1 MAG: hypothetical protein A2290_00685 [candidate division WOR-1 bacterium RIFOXYB2_FULL_36_35]OGC18777.1 MAG: hypothetical protein A2282_05400 [candidate division WOR-1 bacterium RIFOXYA12_FULL_36_13]OGC40702.1 MAG: hypothetical protein A2526_01475 [candidate division WOR-1 bacterium RIFOXYD2_FULL_36_8]
MVEIEKSIEEQIRKLSVMQYLIWQNKLPEGINWQAVQISFCYHLMKVPLEDKLSNLAFGILNVKLTELIKSYNLPTEIAELKRLEKEFRLTLGGQDYPVSDCSTINRLLEEEGSNLRLCSGFYGEHKFFIFGEASCKKVKDYLVYRFKSEVAVTPGCHLLVAAMVSGKNIFLRETSARFLFYQKWRDFFQSSEPRLFTVKPEINPDFLIGVNNRGEPDQKLIDKIKRVTLNQFEIKTEKDFKTKSKKFISSFMDNLFLHELNHNSAEKYIKDKELLSIAKASTVLDENILSHLLEVFTDWLPGDETKSPLGEMFKNKKLDQLSLYVADNWFFDSSFPEMEIFSALCLIPLFYNFKEGNFDWNALNSEIYDLGDKTLMGLYCEYFEKIALELKKIVEESEFVLVDRSINFRTISLYINDKIKNKNKNLNDEDYQVTYWSEVFNYLKQFSKSGCNKALSFLKKMETELKYDVIKRLNRPGETVGTLLISKTTEFVQAL